MMKLWKFKTSLSLWVVWESIDNFGGVGEIEILTLGSGDIHRIVCIHIRGITVWV